MPKCGKNLKLTIHTESEKIAKHYLVTLLIYFICVTGGVCVEERTG